LASTPSTVVSDGHDRGFQSERATGTTAGAREHLVEGRTTRFLDQPRAEVLLKRLACLGRSPLEDRTGVLGHVLDLDARHGAILAPLAPMCKLQRTGSACYAPLSNACLGESSTGAVPIQAPKGASAKSLPSMVPTSLPLVATTVPVPGM